VATVLTELNAAITPLVKPLATGAYLVVGLFFLFATLHRTAGDLAGAARAWTRGETAVVAVAAVLTLRYFLDQNHAFALVVVLTALVSVGAALIWRRPVWATGVVPTATVAVVISAAWWMLADETIDWVRVGVALALLTGITALQLRPDPRATTGWWPWVISTPVILLVLADLSSITAGSEALSDMASHWSAFIAPAEQVRAGLVPLFDLPLKYGAGPLTLTIAGCTSAVGCWSGLHVSIVLLSVATWCLMLHMALTVTRPRSRWWRAAITAVLGLAMFMWPGAPYLGIAPMLEPATTGLRLFALVLVAHQLFCGRPRGAACAFALALVWSVEVAVWATVVYGVTEAARLGFRTAAARVAGLVAAMAVASLTVYRLVFQRWPDPQAFVEDLIVVPGAQDLLPVSSLLLLAATLGLGGWLLWYPRADPIERQRDTAVVMLWFVTSSYYLGSGHNNNLCAMLAFLVLLGCRVADREREPTPGRVACAMASGQAALVAALVFSSWEQVPYRNGVQWSIAPVVAAMPALYPDVEVIRSRLPIDDGLGIATFATVRRDVRETTVWTPVEPYDTWGAMSSARRRVYIARGAARLSRPGWAIFSAKQDDLFGDLETSYRVAESWTYTGRGVAGRSGEEYRVVKWIPR
jgi:hypothetical protein